MHMHPAPATGLLLPHTIHQLASFSSPLTVSSDQLASLFLPFCPCGQMENARRRHVPEFGKWNHSYGDEPWLPIRPVAAAGCYSTHAAEQEACSEVWFRYSPPPRKPAPKKVRRPGSSGVAPAERTHDGGKTRLRAARQSRASDASAVAITPTKAARTVRRPVDADLYQVPPPDFVCHRPRPKKRVVRRMWMGCLGLSCVA